MRQSEPTARRSGLRFGALKTLSLFFILVVTWDHMPGVTYEIEQRYNRRSVIIPLTTEYYEVQNDLEKSVRFRVRSVNQHGKSAWTKAITFTKKTICYEN